MANSMFKNYLKVAFRKIKRQKGHSFINILSLSVGIAGCLLLFLWVQDELSYDRFHENADRIYRVNYQYEADGRVERRAKSPAPLAPALVNEFPWIQKAVRFAKTKDLVKYRKKVFRETIHYTDPEIFDVFTFPLVKGNPKTVLDEPRLILISEKMRNKYFGDEDPLGKTIILGENKNYKITGIFKNVPRNSHFRFDFLAAFKTYRPDYLNQWGVSNFWTYILVSKNIDREFDTFRETMPQFVEKYRGKDARHKYKIKYLLQPLTRIHLYSNLHGEQEPNMDIKTIYIISAVALFILLIACLNYINLATARFITRTREAGLRRVLGANRSQLIRQSLGESFLIVMFALPFAILLAELFLPLYNSLSGKSLSFRYFDNPILLLSLLGIILLVGLISGIVPAIFLTAFRPTDAMKGVVKTSPVIAVLRRVLVVFQFSMSIIFIICVLIVSHQMKFTRTKDLGLNKENVVHIRLNNNKEALLKYNSLKNEFSKSPDVTVVTASGFLPGRPYWNMNYQIKGIADNDYRSISFIPVDYDFIKMFDIKIVEGRGFSKDFPTDGQSALIINEAARKQFGWQSAVGKGLKIAGSWREGIIIGVVKDFSYNSLHKKIKPVVLYIVPEHFRYISVRITPHNVTRTINFLKNKWEELIHNKPFVYSFFDEDFDSLYKSDMRMLKIFLVVTLLEIFIACLGLLGLAAFSAERRTREIGIRKVFGASISEIVRLLSKDFTRWVLISNIIAWPIAWYAMHRWLKNFAFRIDILPWPFLLAGGLALVIALLTISYKAIRAAVADPVKTLRYE